MSRIKPTNFEALRAVYDACVTGALSFTVQYTEIDDNWLFDIGSPAPTECFHIKRTADFDGGVARVMEHLTKLGYAPAPPAETCPTCERKTSFWNGANEQVPCPTCGFAFGHVGRPPTPREPR